MAVSEVVDAELWLRVSKKLAQLTKVVYTLNTRNDALESELERLSKAKEERRHSDSARKELRKAKHIMRHLEAKMHRMEEGNSAATNEINDNKATPKEASDSKEEANEVQVDNKEDGQVSNHVDMKERKLSKASSSMMETKLMEQEALLEKQKRQVAEMQLDLSATRVQLLYYQTLESQRTADQHGQQKVHTSTPTPMVRGSRVELTALNDQLKKVTRERDALSREVFLLRQKTSSKASSLISSKQMSPSHLPLSSQSSLVSKRRGSDEDRVATTATSKPNNSSGEAKMLMSLRRQISDTEQELQKKEKECRDNSERYKRESMEQQEMIESLKTLNASLELQVKTRTESTCHDSRATGTQTSEDNLILNNEKEAKKEKEGEDVEARLEKMEQMLEEAEVERRQLLRAASKEIELERNKRVDVEQRIMDDCEWKIRQMELLHKKKIRELEHQNETHESQSIATRTEKWRLERDKLQLQLKEMQEQLNSSNKEAKEALQRERDDCQRLQSEVQCLQSHLSSASKEYEEQLEEQKGQLRCEWNEKLLHLQRQLDEANAQRFACVMSVREEVASEFTDRMESLRLMYRVELDSLGGRLEEQRQRSKEETERLKQLLEEREVCIDKLNANVFRREEEHESKVAELMHSLDQQVKLVQRLEERLQTNETSQLLRQLEEHHQVEEAMKRRRADLNAHLMSNRKDQQHVSTTHQSDEKDCKESTMPTTTTINATATSAIDKKNAAGNNGCHNTPPPPPRLKIGVKSPLDQVLDAMPKAGPLGPVSPPLKDLESEQGFDQGDKSRAVLDVVDDGSESSPSWPGTPNSRKGGRSKTGGKNVPSPKLSRSLRQRNASGSSTGSKKTNCTQQ